MRQLDDTEGNAKLSEWREELAEGALERDFSVDNHIPGVEVRLVKQVFKKSCLRCVPLLDSSKVEYGGPHGPRLCKYMYLES